MADVLGKKISELAETTDLAGLYTIGSDRNNQSKKVPLQFVKEAADYANAQGDYAKGVGDTIQGNTGVNEYPAFSSSTQYAAGSVVRYNNKLYRFTALHPAGAWVGTDAIETSIKAETDMEVKTYTFKSILSDDKNIAASIFKDMYVIGADNSQDYKITYIGINHSVFGGSGYIGFQVAQIKEGEPNATYLPTNYRANASSWQPNTLYELEGEGNNLGAEGVRLFIRTSDNFSLPIEAKLISGVELIRLLSTGKGDNVTPFFASIESNISDIESNIKNLHSTFEFVNILSSNKAIFENHIKDIYVVGMKEQKDVVVSYLGINSNIFVGVGYIGLQIAIWDGSLLKPTNYRANASSWQPNTLYELEGEDNNLDAEGLKVFIRTSDNFSLTSDVVLFSGFPILRLTELGKGNDVMPFVSAKNDATKAAIIVSASGNGDYTTLTEATDNAPNGATIYVMPGIYDNECVVAGKTKTLYIIGIDRDKCVIKNSYGDYSKAPIHIASGCLKNLTIISESTKGNEYAVHADFDTMIGSTLNIENCTMQSNSANAGGLGIGLRGGGHLTIKSCRLISSQKGRALYLHDNDVNLDTHFGLQKFSAIDCIFESPDEAILIQGQGKSDRDFSKIQFYIEFVRNAIKGTANFVNWYGSDLGEVTEDDFQGVKNLRLVGTSFGNSNDVFNAL